MICALLQDLHLVQSIDCTSELPRRYHSVRMDILTPYGKVFPTRTVGNGSTYRRKSGSLAFSFSLSPSSFFAFASLRLCVFCVLVRVRCRGSRGENEVWFSGREREKGREEGEKRKKSLEVRMLRLFGEGDLFFFSSKWRRGQEGFGHRTATT